MTLGMARPRSPRNAAANTPEEGIAACAAISFRACRVLLCVVILFGVGCASHQRPPARPAPEALPLGSPLLSRSLSDSDAWLRHYLMLGDHTEAIAAATAPRSPLAPRDPLVRALQEAVLRHQAGDYEGSNRAFEWAEIEAERRYTRSVSRAAASLLVNDGVISYTPSPGELLMVPYYRMLNYLALGDVDGALVESRKANTLLRSNRGGATERCREEGLLQYLAGLVQGAGRERNDALVSLRLAEESFRGCPGSPPELEQAMAGDLWRAANSAGVLEIADSIAGVHPDAFGHDASGDLVLLLEQGYIAHRAEQTLHIPIFPEDVEGLESGDEEGIASAASRLAGRMIHSLWEREATGTAWNDVPIVQWAQAIEGAYILRLAWPALRMEAARPAATRVWVGDSLVAATAVGDLSAVLQQDLEAQRTAILTRAVARGVVKFLAAREVEKRTDDRSGEVAAFVVGRLANLASNHLEQADLRSWSLLPDRISMIRIRLPDGTYPIRLETLSRDGSVASVEDLGEVAVRANGLSVLSRRVWGSEPGALPSWSGGAVRPTTGTGAETAKAEAAILKENRPEP